MQNAGALRERALDALRNDWAGEAVASRWTTTLIGTGIVPRMKRVKAGPRKSELQSLWDAWVAESDADCVLNFYAQQALVARSWIGAGEVFVRRRYRSLKYGMSVPMQVQVIESHFVPYLDSDSQPGMAPGNRIRSGIELDRRGRRIAYWVYKEHPGDGATGYINGDDLVRVPAEEMAHIYEVLRPGQLRGISPMAPILARLRNISDYDDTVLERQKLANLFVGFITEGVGANGEIDPLTGAPAERDASGADLAGLEPGLLQKLGYGEDVKFANPPEAGTTYSDYMRTQHMGTAAGAGMPYELMSGDINNISDRTLRVLVNEFRRLAEQRQWLTLIPQFCQKVRDWWADAATLAGLVNVEEAEDVRLVTWAPHGWAYMHPVQDAQGKQLEVQAGFRSRDSVISERGEDPEDVDNERAAEKARAEKLGLAPETVANDPADKPAGGQKDDEQKTDEEDGQPTQDQR